MGRSFKNQLRARAHVAGVVFPCSQTWNLWDNLLENKFSYDFRYNAPQSLADEIAQFSVAMK